jgi:hypothetical protein
MACEAMFATHSSQAGLVGHTEIFTLTSQTKELACGHDLTCRVLWVSGVPKVLQGVPQKCRKSTLLEVVHESP